MSKKKSKRKQRHEATVKAVRRELRQHVDRGGDVDGAIAAGVEAIRRFATYELRP